MATSINHRYFFPHTPEVVWEYLTNAELMELWLMKNDFQPVVGHDFQFRTNPMPNIDFDGICHCKVLDIVPFERLSYSWKTGPGDGTIAIDTVVVWTLQAINEGTELVLEHSGFRPTDNINMYNALNGGWLKNIQKIAERINMMHGTTNA